MAGCNPATHSKCDENNARAAARGDRAQAPSAGSCPMPVAHPRAAVERQCHTFSERLLRGHWAALPAPQQAALQPNHAPSTICCPITGYHPSLALPTTDMPRTTKARAPALLAPAASLLAPAAALLVLLLLAAPATAARALKAESTLDEAAASDLPLGSQDPAASLPGDFGAAGGAQAAASSDQQAVPQASPAPARKTWWCIKVSAWFRGELTLHLSDWNVSGRGCFPAVRSNPALFLPALSHWHSPPLLPLSRCPAALRLGCRCRP